GAGGGVRVAAEDDVGAGTGHVGRDGDGADAAGLGDDLGLAGGELRLGVEQFVLDAAALEHGAELLRLLDVGGANQHWPAAAVNARDVVVLECLPDAALARLEIARLLDP